MAVGHRLEWLVTHGVGRSQLRAIGYRWGQLVTGVGGWSQMGARWGQRGAPVLCTLFFLAHSYLLMSCVDEFGCRSEGAELSQEGQFGSKEGARAGWA